MPAKKNETLVRLGEALRKERKAKGFSQEGLALEAEVNKTYMGSLERGEENVSVLTLQKIALVLKIPSSTILAKAGL